MRTILLVMLLAFSARADAIVDLNVQSTWVRNYNQPNLPNRESLTYNFVDRWDETTGHAYPVYVSETGSPNLIMYFDIRSGGLSQYGAFFPSVLENGDNFQIIPTNYDYNPNQKPFGTPGFNIPAEVDIFCVSAVCTNFMSDGDFLEGQANFSSISITPITTPEMSTGASLAAGLLLSSALILYNRRRKETYADRRSV